MKEFLFHYTQLMKEDFENVRTYPLVPDLILFLRTVKAI
jgi:hypothetical protein